MRRLTYFIVMFASVLILLTGCGNDNPTGPVEVKWDRDACTRCQMMLSDHNFSAQVRVFPEGKRSKVYKFDDMGCAVLWLEEQPYKDDPKTEIWVNDYKTKQWLDARKAWFVKGEISPMGYGLGAEKEKTEGALNFEQAVKHIKEVENKLNIHGGNLKH